MTNEKANNMSIPRTTQEKIDLTKSYLLANVSPGIYTWADVRHKCGYEIIWGNANNKRDRQKFKELLHQLADIEELSTTKCRINKIYSDNMAFSLSFVLMSSVRLL